MIVFTIGFMVILMGIALAKKLRLIGGTMINKNDTKMIEKAKRALGLSSTFDPTPLVSERAPSNGPNDSSMKGKVLSTLKSIGQLKKKSGLMNSMREQQEYGVRRRRQPPVNPNQLLGSSGAGRFEAVNFEAAQGAANEEEKKNSEDEDIEFQLV